MSDTEEQKVSDAGVKRGRGRPRKPKSDEVCLIITFWGGFFREKKNTKI